MTESTQNRYWLDQMTDTILQQAGDGPIVVSSGHSPSGVYHVGTLREILTADLIAWSLRQQETGREIRHLDVVDDLDALRKIPKNIPDELKIHLGKPLHAAPDPFDCGHASYGDHFLSQLQDSLERLGVRPEVIRSQRKYQEGAFVPYVEQALRGLPAVRRIITEVGGRELDEGWAPVQVLSDNGSLREWKYAGWSEADGTVAYTDRDGKTGEVSYRDEPGRVKLDWRLDWPARWHLYGVKVEPFGRDHATKGGSYDTGAVLVREVFGGQAPFPVPYEFILPVGETKKMSKSAGNVVTPADMLDVMPAEVLRYFFARPRPGRTLPFDTGTGLLALLEEYSKLKLAAAQGEEVPDENALRYAAQTGGGEADSETVSPVPFPHLVQVYQASGRDAAKARDILARTGYPTEGDEAGRTLERQFSFVANWLDKYAPEQVKFELQAELPDVELSDGQRRFLQLLAGKVESQELDGQGMHDAVYAAKDEAEISPGEAFKAIYRVLLAKDAGPRAGWFLSSLDQKWLASRLRLEH